MKYTIALIITVLISIMGCKKTDYTFSTNEITETDINGNLTGNINKNDWKLLPLSSATEFDLNVFKKIIIGHDKFDITDYNSCDSMFNFEVIAYPNPLSGNNCTLEFKYDTNLEIVKNIIIIALKNGDIVVFGSRSDGMFPTEYNIAPLVKRDFICYTIYITSDNCVFFSKGNVIGCGF